MLSKNSDVSLAGVEGSTMLGVILRICLPDIALSSRRIELVLPVLLEGDASIGTGIISAALSTGRFVLRF